MEHVSLIIGSGFGAIFVKELFSWLIKKVDGQNSHDRMSRQDTRLEFDVLFERQQKEIDYGQKRMDEITRREDDCKKELIKLWRMHERQGARIQHLENELTRNKIEFLPWSRKDEESEEHLSFNDDYVKESKS